MNRLWTSRSLCLLIALALLLLGAPSVALAGTNPGVLPPNARPTYPNGEGKTHPYGKTYGQWSAAWWQWAIANPDVFDDDGTNCHVGQAGKVFFLAGNFGGQTTRYCTIPTGTPLFFPIINTAYYFEPTKTVEEGEACAPYLGNTPAILECMRQIIKHGMDSADGLEVTIDGKKLKNLKSYRVQSPVFSLMTQDGTVFDLALADGYFIMLSPLPPGNYTIRFAGRVDLPEFPGVEFELEVTYHLTVRPKGRHSP